MLHDSLFQDAKSRLACFQSIQAAKVYQYSLPLRYPLTTKNSESTVTNGSHKQSQGSLHTLRSFCGTREGLLIALIDQDGITGWGEIAPLPGLHVESLHEAILQIQSVFQTFLVFNQQRFDKDPDIQELLERNKLFPSVRWGIETALLHLWQLQTAKEPQWKQQHLPISALIQAMPVEKMIEQAQACFRQGYNCLKCKVGHLHPEDAALLVQQLGGLSIVMARSRQATRPSRLNKLQIRLDIASRWTLQQACDFAQRIEPEWIQYLEDPLQNPWEIPQLHQKTGIECAIDSGFHPQLLQTDIALRGVKAWVVKPAILAHGMQQFDLLVQKSQQLGVQVVLSSCFESSVGLSQLAFLANRLPCPWQAAGLQTFSWFLNDVMTPLVEKNQIAVHLPSLWKQLQQFDASQSEHCHLICHQAMGVKQ